MKKEIKIPKARILNGFSKILVVSVVVATILNAIFFVSESTVFLLNENQLLYLFSSMAQVIGGVFGLTLTAYVFFVDKFKESTDGDDTLYDAATSILSRYFRTLISLAICTGAIVLLCVFGIINLHQYIPLGMLVVNESVLLFSIGLISILAFGAMLLDPQKLEKEIAKMKKSAEEYYKASEDSMSGDFVTFLRTYNLLQSTILNLAEKLIQFKSTPYVDKGYKPQIIQALRTLTFNEIITRTLNQEINELRMYRNGLVHGIDFDVTQTACERINEIYNALKDVLDTLLRDGKDSEKYSEAVARLHKLG